MSTPDRPVSKVGRQTLALAAMAVIVLALVLLWIQLTRQPPP